MAQQLATALGQLLDQGFRCPLFVAIVAINGVMFYFRYDPVPDRTGLMLTALAEYLPDPAVFAAPST